MSASSKLGEAELAAADTESAGNLTLGEVVGLCHRTARAELEVATHKARAHAAEQSRDRHARELTAALAELPEALEFVRGLRTRYQEKGALVGDRLITLDAADVDSRHAAELERRSYGAAVSTCDAVVFRLEATLEQKRGG